MDKPFHHLDLYLFRSSVFKFNVLQDPYFDSKTFFHKPTSGDLILHNHFANKALLNRLMHLIPRSPSSFGLHMFSQLHQAIFLPFTPHPYKNFLWIFMIFLHTPLRVLKNYKKNNGTALTTDFMRQTLPPKDKFLPFHTESFFLIFDSIVSQKEHLEGLPPIGRPK